MRQRRRKLLLGLLIGTTFLCVTGLALNHLSSGMAHQSASSEPTGVKQAEPDLRQTRPAFSVDFLQPQQKNRSGVVALPIALRMSGFAPAEITRPAGDYFIAVSNLTDLPEIVLTLDREGGGRLHSARVQPNKRAWRQQVRLHPGSYVLSVMDHSEWSCRITITAQ
jgi:hypothetical protein